MHRSALCLVFVVATAHADEFVGNPGHAFGAAWALRASNIGQVREGGMGGLVEAALGVDRVQYFGELTVTAATLQAMPHVPGYFGEAGVGARWLARQFQIDRGGGFEMFLEAVAGVERYWWKDGGELTRPDFGVGVGLQMRAWGVHGATARFGSRIIFAPTDRESPMVACRGTGCPVGTSTSPAGYMATIGIAW